MSYVYAFIYPILRKALNGEPPPVATNHLLFEDGQGFLLETGGHLETE